MSTLTMVHGDTPSFDVLVVHPVTGDPVDLTNADISMTAVPSWAATDLGFSIGTDSGDIEVVPDETGRALITVPVTATDQLPNEFLRLFFDVVVELGADTWTTDRGMLLHNPRVPSP